MLGWTLNDFVYLLAYGMDAKVAWQTEWQLPPQGLVKLDPDVITSVSIQKSFENKNSNHSQENFGKLYKFNQSDKGYFI